MALRDENLIEKIRGLSRTEALNYYRPDSNSALMRHPWVQMAVLGHQYDIKNKNVSVLIDETDGYVTEVDGTDQIPSETTVKEFYLTASHYKTNTRISVGELESNTVQPPALTQFGGNLQNDNSLAVYERKGRIMMQRIFNFCFDKFVKTTIGLNSYIDTYNDYYVPPTLTVNGTVAGDERIFSPYHFRKALAILDEKSLKGQSYANLPVLWIVPKVIDEIFGTKAWVEFNQFDKTGITVPGFFDENLTATVMSGGRNVFIAKVPTHWLQNWHFNTADEDGRVVPEYDSIHTTAEGTKYASWLMTLDAAFFAQGAYTAAHQSGYRIIGAPGGFTLGETISTPGNALNAIKDVVLGVDLLFGTQVVYPERIVRLDIFKKA